MDRGESVSTLAACFLDGRAVVKRRRDALAAVIELYVVYCENTCDCLWL